ncbi:MAG: hypothetical protein M3328_12190, partial [Chloroflexota bacterium]|nr:hypothetical protein [Chloroflexota bacterium]
MNDYKIWEAQIGTVGLGHAYSMTGPDVPYPPLYLYLLRLLAFFYAPPLPVDYTNAFFSVFMKAPIILLDLLIGLVLFVVVKRLQPRVENACLAAAAYMLNPGVIFDTGYWGSFNSLLGLFALGSLAALVLGRGELSTVLLLLAVLVKPQAMTIVPVVLWLVFTRYGLKTVLRGGLLALCMAVLIGLPFLAAGQLSVALAKTTGDYVGYFPFVSLNAHNPWWLLSLAFGTARLPDNEALVFGLTLRHVGLALFGLCILAITILGARAYRRRLALGSPGTNWLPFEAAALASIGFFALSTEVHENHLYLAVPFLAVVAWRSTGMWRGYWFLSVVWLLNMVLQDTAIQNVLVQHEASTSGPLLWVLQLISLTRNGMPADNVSLATAINAVAMVGLLARASWLLLHMQGGIAPAP